MDGAHRSLNERVAVASNTVLLNLLALLLLPHLCVACVSIIRSTVFGRSAALRTREFWWATLFFGACAGAVLYMVLLPFFFSVDMIAALVVHGLMARWASKRAYGT